MKTVLITGASAGIGWASLCRLAGRGHRVVGTTRSLERRRDRVQETQQRWPGQVHWVEMDVTREDSVAAGCQEALAKLTTLDAVVCNAGIVAGGAVEEVPLAAGQALFDTNLWGCVRVLQAVLPTLRRQGHGRVVLVGSLAGLVTMPFHFHYSASKYAVESLAESLRYELAPLGLTVCLVRPGDVQSEIVDQAVLHSRPGSAYATVAQRVWAEACRQVREGPSADLVAERVQHAVEARRPARTSVAAAGVAAWTPWLVRVMPLAWKEAVVRRLYRA